MVCLAGRELVEGGMMNGPGEQDVLAVGAAQRTFQCLSQAMLIQRLFRSLYQLVHHMRLVRMDRNRRQSQGYGLCSGDGD
jgi:hypothetical protein